MMVGDDPAFAAVDNQEAEAGRIPERVEADAQNSHIVDHDNPAFLDGDLFAAAGKISEVFPQCLGSHVDLRLGRALQDRVGRVDLGQSVEIIGAVSRDPSVDSGSPFFGRASERFNRRQSHDRSNKPRNETLHSQCAYSDQAAAYTASFAAFTGRALTIFRAGLALNTVGSFVNGLMPARSFVAGFLITTNFAKPGSKNAPFFFNSL